MRMQTWCCTKNDLLIWDKPQSAGLPACLIGRCCSGFCCCAFLLRLNQVPPLPPSYYLPPPLTPTPSPTPTPTSVPLLLPPFVVPVVPVVYRYSSQNAHGTKLIDWYSFGMRSVRCCRQHLLLKLLLIYGSVFVSSSSSSSFSLLFCFSLRLPPRVYIFPWSNLSPLPPCLLPCSGLLSSQRLIHSTWRYFAGGGTNLVYDQCC